MSRRLPGKRMPAAEGARTRKRIVHHEDNLQRALLKSLALMLPSHVFMFAVPNGGYRAGHEASIMAGLGVTPGVPDLVFIHGGRAVFLELKSLKGVVSDAQLFTHDRIRRAGAPVGIARDVQAALTFLHAQGIPINGRIAA